MFSPHAAPRTGASVANEAQCCLVAGFLVVFFIISFDVNVTKRNIKQKLFCEKQGKGSVDAWQKMGHGLNPWILQAGGPSPALAAEVSRSSFSAQVGGMSPTGVGKMIFFGKGAVGSK